MKRREKKRKRDKIKWNKRKKLKELKKEEYSKIRFFRCNSVLVQWVDMI